MEFTRRDALGALAGAGILGGGSVAVLARDGFAEEAGKDPDGSGRFGDLTAESEAVLAAMVATATVVYPSAVANVRAFVESYGATKLAERPAFAAAAAETLTALDGESRISFDAAFVDLAPGDREVVLGRVGADTAEPDPDGTAAERVRYYFVNETLFALYTSPTGGRLVGLENPQGHPGGTDSYQRGPPG